MPLRRRSIAERVPVCPQVDKDDSQQDRWKTISAAYAPLTNNAFEPWIGLKAIRPFAEWVPADPNHQALWSARYDNKPHVALIDFPDYGPFAAVAGMHPRMSIGEEDEACGIAIYGLESDVEYTDSAEPTWVLHGRIWDDGWRAQSSALCGYLLTFIYAQTPSLTMTELLRRAREGETAVTGGGTYLNRYGARMNAGWYRCAPAMCSIGVRGDDHPDEPLSLFALDSDVTLLEPLTRTLDDVPTIPIRHALQQCTMPEGEPFTGSRVWTHLNNRPDEYITELNDLDLNSVFLISVMGESVAKLTSIVMLESYYDWLVSIMLPEIPHGLYLSLYAQSALRHIAKRLKDKNRKAEEEMIFRNWLRDVLMDNVTQQVEEIILVNKLTWGNWLGQIVLHDPNVPPKEGIVHELLTGVFDEQLWRAIVDSHWSAITKAFVRWDVEWETLDGLDIKQPHIVDRLSPGSSLAKSSRKWMQHGQIAYALMNMKPHPFLDPEWIEPGIKAPCYTWESDSVLCRYHERELSVTSRVEKDTTVELTWHEDLTPGKAKKVVRAELVLGILPELTTFLSQYCEQDGSWILGSSHVPQNFPLSKLTCIIEDHFQIDSVAAMTLILALAACGILDCTGDCDCWSVVASNEIVEGSMMIDCDVPLQLAGRLCRARKLDKTFFAVPLTPNDTAVFDVGSSSLLKDGFQDMPILHSEEGWIHSETGHVEDWFAGIDEPLPVCKLGLRPLLVKTGGQQSQSLSGPVPQGSSLEWVISWAQESLGIEVPLSTDQIEENNNTITLKMRRRFWRLFECEKIIGAVGVRKLIGVSIEFKRLYAGIFRVNTWVALEKLIRNLAAQANVAEASASDYISISEVTNCIMWYATLCNQNLKIGPAEKALWVPAAQRGDGFLCDRDLLIPSWMGRRITGTDELEILVTEKQAVNLGSDSAMGRVSSYTAIAVPTSGHTRGEFVGGSEIKLMSL